MTRNNVDVQRALDLVGATEDDAPVTQASVDRFAVALHRMREDPAEAARVDRIIAAVGRLPTATPVKQVPATSAIPEEFVRLQLAELLQKTDRSFKKTSRQFSKELVRAIRSLGNDTTVRARMDREPQRSMLPAASGAWWARPYGVLIALPIMLLLVGSLFAVQALSLPATVVAIAGATSALVTTFSYSLSLWTSARRLTHEGRSDEVLRVLTGTPPSDNFHVSAERIDTVNMPNMPPGLSSTAPRSRRRRGKLSKQRQG